jgi:transposase
VLVAFKKWLDDQAPKVLPESLTGKANSYARNQWEYLTRYVHDGLAPIDNNVIERDIRPFVTMRSLCTPLSSVWKHWKLVLETHAIPSLFAPQRDLNRLALQV